MKTSKRQLERLDREDGCRTARRALEAARRRRDPVIDAALHRLRPLG